MNPPVEPTSDDTRVPTTYHTVFPAEGCAGCFECMALLSLLLGAALVGLAIWLSFGLRELYRGRRLEIQPDFSKEGIYAQEVPVTLYRDLRLYCARKYGWNRHPDPELLKELRFRCTIKDATGAVVDSAEFNGIAFTEESDGIDLLELPLELRDTTFTVEIHVLRGVEAAKGLPLSLYLHDYVCGLPALSMISLPIGLFLMAFGGILWLSGLGIRHEKRIAEEYQKAQGDTDPEPR